jgi:sugar phosphate isomerase/epimerase
MRKITRRDFLGTSGSLIAAGTVAGCTEEDIVKEVAKTPASSKPFDHPLSFQSYGMRRQIEKDFPGTLRAVQELGYQGVEMCSPRSYGRSGFGRLTDTPPEEIARIIEESGLFCKSCHFQSSEVIGEDARTTAELAETSAEYAARFGLEDIVMSGSGIGRQGTIDDFKRWGELCTVAGEVVKTGGLRLGYHNHAIDPVMEDGKTLQYDLIMSVCDPELVTMQFQLASIAGGYDIVGYLEKYAGRFTALHMHDYDPEKPGRREGQMGSIVPCGDGIIDWPALLETALKSPITDHGFIVEIETEEPFEGLRKSINFLKTVEI